MGLAGGLARGSARSGAAAGLAGAVLGGALALGAAAALQPVYYRNVQLDQVEQGLTVPMLVHGGIWGAAGLAGGLAFGLGLGRGRSSIARAALGGLAGVLLAAFVFEATAAMAFPTAATTRPLSLTPGSRLMAKMLASLLSAAGIAALLAGRPAAPASGPEPTRPEPAAGAPGPDGPGPETRRPGSGHRAKKNGARHRVSGAWPRSVSTSGTSGAGRAGDGAASGPAADALDGSVGVGADHLAAVAGAQAPPDVPGDRALDEPDAAVGHRDVHPARVGTGGAELKPPLGQSVAYAGLPLVS